MSDDKKDKDPEKPDMGSVFKDAHRALGLASKMAVRSYGETTCFESKPLQNVYAPNRPRILPTHDGDRPITRFGGEEMPIISGALLMHGDIPFGFSRSAFCIDESIVQSKRGLRGLHRELYDEFDWGYRPKPQADPVQKMLGIAVWEADDLKLVQPAGKPEGMTIGNRVYTQEEHGQVVVVRGFTHDGRPITDADKGLCAILDYKRDTLEQEYKMYGLSPKGLPEDSLLWAPGPGQQFATVEDHGLVFPDVKCVAPDKGPGDAFSKLMRLILGPDPKRSFVHQDIKCGPTARYGLGPEGYGSKPEDPRE